MIALLRRLFARRVTSPNHPVFASPTPKENQPMSLLSDVESRFVGAEERVVSDAEKAARSHIGQTLIAAAKEILPLLPEGREASLVVTKLEEVESWAHRALSAGASAATEVQTVAGDVATEAAAVAADVPTPPVEAPAPPPAPPAPPAAPEVPAAPAANPGGVAGL